MNPSGTNDLIITIGGDLTNLDAAFEQITATAQQAFASIETSLQAIDWSPITDGASRAAQSFDTVDTSATTTSDDLANLADAASSAGAEMADIGDSAETAQSGVASLGESVSTASEAASGAAQNFETLTPEVEHAGEAAGEAQQGFSSLYGQLLEFGEALAITEGLKEFGEEALTVYGNTEKVSISLTALTGSATQANETIEALKETATSDALSFPQLTAAAQKMTALGFSTEQMNTVLQSAADTAAATGNEFSSVSNSIDRMVLSGTAGARQLATLGINAQQLNTAMGEAGAGVDASAGQITKAFTALDQAARLDALTTSLQKFDGVAEQVAQGVSGQWQNLKTQFEFVMEGIGQALAPVISAMLSFASSTIIPAIQAMVGWFNELPGPIKDAAVAVTLLVASLGPVAVAVGGFALAMTGLRVALAEVATEEGLLGTATVALGGIFSGAATAIESVVVAVSSGLVGALTTGETVLLGFTAAAAGVATAFVAWDQIKQLIQNIENLNAVLTQGIPLWNDLKSAASDAGDAIGGAVSLAFSVLLGSLGPVDDAIKSIGAYLPSFSSMWQDVKNAVNSIHWSDLIGPIGALNGALKSLADAIQLVTGHYPAMATAGTTALATLQAANDKLNASMATQASAVTTAATAVTAHATATAAATPVVAAHAQAVSQTAAAANAAAESFLALQPTLAQLGITSGTVVNGVEMVGSSMRQAQIEATNLGIQLIQVTGSANATGMAAGTAGQAFRNAASGLVSWSNALQDWVYPYKAASYGVDDLTEGTAAYTAAVERATASGGSFASSLSPGIVSAASSAGVAVEGLTGKVGKLGQELQSVQNLVTSFDANMKAFASSADSLGSELDAAFGDTGKGISGVSESLQAGDQYTTHTTSGLGGNGLGFQDPSELVGLDSAALQALQFDSMQMTYDPQDVTQAATATQSLATSATAAATATSTLATATTAVNDATTSITIPALNALNDGLTSVSTSTAGLSSAALNGQSAVTSLTAAATSASTALADTGTAAATVGGVFVQATTATQSFIQAANSAATYVASALGPGQGVGGGQSLIPLIGSVITPIIDNAAASGVGGGATGIDGPSVTFNIPINAGTVVGANGMQQLAQMVGNQLVSSLASRGIRMNRQ